MEKLNQWLTLLANVGVLAGIVFLAVEFQQNTASIRGSAYQGWMAANIELNMAFSDENMALATAMGLEDSKDLTQETWAAFAMWHMAAMQMAQATDYMYQMGTIDQELWRVEIERVAGMLTVPGIRQWWDAGAKHQLSPSFVKLVETTQPSGNGGYQWTPEAGFVPAVWNQGEHQRSDEQ